MQRFEAMVPILLKAIRSIVSPHVNMYSSPQPAQVMRHVSPTRGTDWYDGGRYQQLQFHTWDANNTAILSVWRYNFTGVSKINAIIYQVEQSSLTDQEKKVVEAELRGLRAYYYYNLLDNFGNVPISTSFTEKELPKKRFERAGI